MDIPPDDKGQPILDGLIIGSEDCLYLNIYVPISEKKMPVIFLIHGGAFMCASGNPFGHKYLADKNIILVTINYRLGLLGIEFSFILLYVNCIYFIPNDR